MQQGQEHDIHIKEPSVEIVDISLTTETNICVSQGVVKESMSVAIKLPPQEFKHLGGEGNDNDVDMALFGVLHAVW
jgi:hypothetical protein